jgi:hypothetical protein
MSRREDPAVADAIAVWDCETAPEQPQTALDRYEDGVRLLHDIITIFDQRKVDRLRTSDLIEGLSTIEGRPCTGMSSENHCAAQKLARLLRPLLIRPKTLRFVDRTAKGYERRWFAKALRGLPSCDRTQG